MKKRLSLDELKYKFRKYNSSSFGKLDNIENDMCSDYIQHSKLDNNNLKEISKRTSYFYNKPVMEMARDSCKNYNYVKKYSLEESDLFNDDFIEVIKRRKTKRKYTGDNITSIELYYLLNYSYGLSREEEVTDNNGLKVKWNFRYSPSPGGLYSSELYFISINSHFEKGLYHFNPLKNSIELIKEGDFIDVITNDVGCETYVEDCSKIGICVLLTSVIQRIHVKYGLRAYRFALIEVGILLQSITLISTHLFIKNCIIGSYLDDKINDFIGVDGYLETVNGAIILGK